MKICFDNNVWGFIVDAGETTRLKESRAEAPLQVTKDSPRDCRREFPHRPVSFLDEALELTEE